MTSAVCRVCGTDLERFEPVHRGDLDMTLVEVRWKGQTVSLRPSGKLFVSAIVRAEGVPVTLAGLGEAMGCREETNDLSVLVRNHAKLIRRAFRQIDPSFSAIATVPKLGIRWAA